MSEPPLYPAGPEEVRSVLDAETRSGLIEELAQAPGQVRAAVAGLSEDQLQTRYRKWTIRQIVNHLADSHLNAFLRFKLALTEDAPTIKPYHEGRWVELADSREGPLEPALTMMDALHVRWTALLRSMTDEDFQRMYFHPESQRWVSLDEALNSYAWHARHHTAQVHWLLRR